MKDYQDLTIHFLSSAEEIADRMNAVRSTGWTRKKAVEARFHLSSSKQARFIVFECDPIDSRPAARVSLQVHEDNSLEISGIYPLEGSPNPLGIDGYNTVLSDFYSRLVQPLEVKKILTATLFSGEFAMDIELGESLYRKLKGFSEAANKSTGSSHWCDRNRWFDFICSLHKSGTALNASVLMRWLHESEDWPEKQARDLAIEFEFATELLLHYDSRQASQGGP